MKQEGSSGEDRGTRGRSIARPGAGVQVSGQSSNSSPAQLAEKNDDRHVRNKIEGVNRSRGEASETIHHLYMAKEKRYLTITVYESFRTSYKECIRMLNGLEKSLERKLPEGDRRWVAREHSGIYNDKLELDDTGWPYVRS